MANNRKLPNWIKGWLDYCVVSESPQSYLTWSAISTISSTLERRCWMRWGHNLIYPNQYIILVGPSGMARKNDGISLCRYFLDAVGINISASQVTREMLIRTMSNSEKPFALEPTKELVRQCPMTIIPQELSVFLGQQNVEMLAFLTDIWDTDKPTWSYKTKHQGSDTIVGPCVNLIGATAPDWLSFILPREAIGGGFTSRCLFISERRKGKIVADPNAYRLDKELEAALLHDLQEISMIQGEYVFAPDVHDEYVAWYTSYETAIQDHGKFPIEDVKLHGYVSRRATHIKKVCMAITAARTSERVIQMSDWKIALGFLEGIERRMPEVFSLVGENRNTVYTQMVLNHLLEHGDTRRSTLLRLFARDIDMWTMKRVEEHLLATEAIRLAFYEDAPTDPVYQINRAMT